jgi:hypothetical protein
VNENNMGRECSTNENAVGNLEGKSYYVNQEVDGENIKRSLRYHGVVLTAVMWPMTGASGELMW